MAWIITPQQEARDQYYQYLMNTYRERTRVLDERREREAAKGNCPIITGIALFIITLVAFVIVGALIASGVIKVF